MELSPLSRLKVRGMRPIVEALRASAWVTRLLLARRKEDLERGLDRDVAWMLELGRITGDADLDKSSPVVARRKMLESVALVARRPTAEVLTADTTVPGAAGPLRARTYEPLGLASRSPGLVFVHGGGWVTGDLETHDTLCRTLAIEGKLRIVAIEPRLAPEAPFPAAPDDTLAAFRYVAREAARFGIDDTRLGIGGDSAGGNLSAVVGLETRGDAVRPALTVLIYPAVDATCGFPSHRSLGKGYLLTRDSITWYLDHYVGPGHERRKDPRLSPFFTPDVSGAPPALVSIAGFDPLRDEAEAYVEKLAAAGVETHVLRSPSLPHGFTLMTALSPASLEATVAIARKTGELLAAAPRHG